MHTSDRREPDAPSFALLFVHISFLNQNRQLIPLNGTLPESAPDFCPVASIVELHGLVSAPQHNGRKGDALS
jgi:hypothetical protein